MENKNTKERSKLQLIADKNYRFSKRLLSGIGDYNDYIHFQEELGVDVNKCHYGLSDFSIDDMKEVMSILNKEVNQCLKDTKISDALKVKLFINNFINIGITVGAQCQFVKDNDEYYCNMRKYLELKK